MKLSLQLTKDKFWFFCGGLATEEAKPVSVSHCAGVVPELISSESEAVSTLLNDC